MLSSKSAEQTDPRRAGYGEFKYWYNVNRVIGAGIGLGLMGKGTLCRLDAPDEGIIARHETLHVEIPIGVVLNLRNFRIGIDFVPNYAYSAKVIYTADNEVIRETDIPDNCWHWKRRSTFSLRATMGGRIPMRDFASVLIAGIFEIDPLNNYTGPDKSTIKERFINLMLVIGLEWGFDPVY